MSKRQHFERWNSILHVSCQRVLAPFDAILSTFWVFKLEEMHHILENVSCLRIRIVFHFQRHFCFDLSILCYALSLYYYFVHLHVFIVFCKGHLRRKLSDFPLKVLHHYDYLMVWFFPSCCKENCPNCLGYGRAFCQHDRDWLIVVFVVFLTYFQINHLST